MFSIELREWWYRFWYKSGPLYGFNEVFSKGDYCVCRTYNKFSHFYIIFKRIIPEGSRTIVGFRECGEYTSLKDAVGECVRLSKEN